MEPAEALRKIAFILEKDRAEQYKIRAFRTAAAAVEEMDPEELGRLCATKRLESIDGVGKTTAVVIEQALRGEVPAYLSGLDDSDSEQVSKEVGLLVQALRGDCHSHSNWSDGACSIEEMANAAKALGREYQALTDHSPRLTVAHGVNAENLRRQIEVVAELNESLAPFRLLTGVEVDILEDGTLDHDDELLSELDVVVASVHSKLRMEEKLMTNRMMTAVANPNVDILGHCTGRIITGKGRPPSTFDHHTVFTACAAYDTAVEINSRPDRRDPPPELLASAISAGCRFSIDTDAHAPGQLSWISLGCEQAVDAGVPTERIVNAMELGDFLKWTSSHSTS